MQGIKPHTHQEREKVIKDLLPMLKEKFADNFIALVADGSYARNEDIEYSDLELIVFLKELPQEDVTIRKIVDGMLIVVVAETRQSYIEKYVEVTDIWYASGAGKLLPIVNEPFIQEINDFKPADKEKKCLEQIQKRWPFYQEITAKVLNNCIQQNSDAIPLSFTAMMKEILVLLSFLNAIAYTTLGTYITQAKQFPIKPKGFEELITIFTGGSYQTFPRIEQVTKEVFADLEEMLLEKGLVLYVDLL